MRRIHVVMLAVSLSFTGAGCAVSYPLLRHEYSNYAGKTVTVQNRAFLLTEDDSLHPRFQIQSGLIHGGFRKVCEIPEGTDLAIGSFWRTRRWYLIGGLVSSDYALVTVDSPTERQVSAVLPVSEFEDVFNGGKYRPKPAMKD